MTASADNSTSLRPVALVTGASSGIGRAIAMQLAAAGHAVALAARREAPLHEVAAAIRSAGGEALVVPCDASDAGAVHELVAHVHRHFGRLDVVVASAGAYLRKPALETTRADVEAMFAANFWSGFELVQAALPMLTAQRRGRLLLIASFDAVVGMPQDAAYVAAKCALRGWASVLRQALRGSGVTLTTALPGRVDTPMIDDLEVPALSAKVSAERVARAALRGMMRRRHGRIVNITSIVGVTGNPGQANYAAAKAGMIGMTKALAQEIANRGITVNCVAPGFIDTEMTRGLDEAQRTALLGRIPAGRLGEGRDIAAAVAYLASDEASYVTGQPLHVDGGMAMI